MVKKIAFGAVAILLAAPVAAYLTIWLLGERILAKTYDIPPAGIVRATDGSDLSHGERIADIAGCTGCHGATLNGKPFGEAPFVYRATAANLARLALTYSDDDFARAIRHGVRKNKRSVNGMPSAAFYDLRDEDLGAIISFIRSKPDAGQHLPATEIRILGRLELLQGLFPPDASTIDHDRPRRDHDLSDPLQQGEYLARIACAECHGIAFTGDKSGQESAPPDLAIAAAYSLDQFSNLMKTGVPVSGRDLRLMGDVARSRFVAFTDDEIAAIHAYLTHRAAN
ncbi:c-type cytochrome [Hyphococcus sp.]|uniref:c-type cytochrome n=1 Tax=Hyphococcus sp. TaxID=2038636 RepID=UPI002084C093|nr:MAG: sorbitol dehydrogenase [Marinicaulis sp.]